MQSLKEKYQGNQIKYIEPLIKESNKSKILSEQNNSIYFKIGYFSYHHPYYVIFITLFLSLPSIIASFWFIPGFNHSSGIPLSTPYAATYHKLEKMQQGLSSIVKIEYDTGKTGGMYIKQEYDKFIDFQKTLSMRTKIPLTQFLSVSNIPPNKTFYYTLSYQVRKISEDYQNLWNSHVNYDGRTTTMYISPMVKYSTNTSDDKGGLVVPALTRYQLMSHLVDISLEVKKNSSILDISYSRVCIHKIGII